MPQINHDNMLIHSILERTWLCRNANGTFDWAVFFRVMELEGLGPDFQLSLFDQARVVEEIVLGVQEKERQEREQQEKQKRDDHGSQPVTTPRPRVRRR